MSEGEELRNDALCNEVPQEQQEAPSVGSSEDFKECCFALRKQLETLKLETRMLQGHTMFDAEKLLPEEHTVWEYSEMKANLMLSYRHLEDARMRLGKAIQAFDGGKSCYSR